MFTPSPFIIQFLAAFAPRLSAPVFSKMATLFCGVILSPGRRTVASALRAVGLQENATFGKYHRVLSRDQWSALLLSKELLFLLIKSFLPEGEIVEILVDETLERRRGAKIAYKGWFRDAVRSTQKFTVTTPGVRWLCLCVLVRVPWSSRRWALPFCTVPVCSEKNCQSRKRLFRGGVGLTVDMLIKVRRWLGSERHIRLTADGGFTSIEMLTWCNELGIEQVGRLRLDAALYDAPGKRPAGKRGPAPQKGARQPGLKQRLAAPKTQWKALDVPCYHGEPRHVEITSGVALWHVDGNPPRWMRWVLVRPVKEEKDAKTKDGKVKGAKARKRKTTDLAAAAFFSSDLNADPKQIVLCYAQRWNIEVFFEEVRACLAFETQRGWSNRTIGRTTPCLFGSFSLVVLIAKRLHPTSLPVSQSVWYTKEDATFRDVLGAVRQHLWRHNIMPERLNNITGSGDNHDTYIIPAKVFNILQNTLCYAA